jgi:hypothetical protein
MKDYTPQYKDKHPKIDLYLDGKYSGSTNYYPTIKQYLASEGYKKGLVPYTGQEVKCKIDKR